jgi:hypothetical protein
MAFGLILVILGVILDLMRPFSRKRAQPITSKMKNKEIARLLQEQERIPFSRLVIAAGMSCFAAGMAWRFGARRFF